MFKSATKVYVEYALIPFCELYRQVGASDSGRRTVGCQSALVGIDNIAGLRASERLITYSSSAGDVATCVSASDQ